MYLVSDSLFNEFLLVFISTIKVFYLNLQYFQSKLKHMDKLIKGRVMFFLFFLLNTSILAQNFEWGKNFGGEYLEETLIDASGNFYNIGFFSGTSDFDPGPGIYNMTTQASHSDTYIQKLDSVGNLIWAKQISAGFSSTGFDIALDSIGNIFAIGYVSSVTDIDPGIGVFTVPEGNFLIKLDSDGEFVWGKYIEGGARNICIDNWQNIYLSGMFSRTKDFDPGPDSMFLTATNISFTDMFVLKLDSLGNFVWARAMGGNNSEHVNDMLVDDKGSVYITGMFKDTVDFDPSPNIYSLIATGDLNAYIQKLDSAGNFIWANRLVGNWGDSEGYSMVLDSFGHLYSTGSFTGTIDFDPSSNVYDLTSNGNADVYIQKLDTGGNFIWARGFGGISNDFGYGITVDPVGNVYTVGAFWGTVDFDPNSSVFYLSNNLGVDSYVHKLDWAGNFIWAGVMVGPHHNGAETVIVDSSNNVFVTGTFIQEIDLNPELGMHLVNSPTTNDRDVFILKLSQCSSNRIDSVVACKTYTWIDGNTYTRSNDTARVILTNSVGCDSIVILNLKIDTVNVSTTLTLDSIIANASGLSYQWLDCNNNYAPIVGKTAQSFHFTVNGNYAVEINESGCIDTSDCVNIVGLNINDIENSKLRIQPNPTTGELMLESDLLGDGIIHIYNIQGQLVYRKKVLSETSVFIDLNHFDAGVYIIEYFNEMGQKHYAKVIKREY